MSTESKSNNDSTNANHSTCNGSTADVTDRNEGKRAVLDGRNRPTVNHGIRDRHRVPHYKEISKVSRHYRM